MLKFLYRIICGFFLGISTLAPGISGSIVAIIVGVYHDLLEVFSNPFKDLKKTVLLLLPVGTGVIISIVVFVIAFSILFERFEKAALLLFAFLIAGNLPIVVSIIKKEGFRKRYLLFILGATVLTYAMGWLAFSQGDVMRAEAVTVGIPFMALSGLASGAALLVPGMSFSMILILMGVYGQLILTVGTLLDFDIAFLLHIAVFGVSVVIGLAFASKLIKAAFNKFPGAANSSVLGFMIGSFLILMVEGIRISDPNFAWWHGVIAAILGLGISVAFVVILRFVNKKES
jgi:putative membrane protein